MQTRLSELIHDLYTKRIIENSSSLSILYWRTFFFLYYRTMYPNSDVDGNPMQSQFFSFVLYILFFIFSDLSVFCAVKSMFSWNARNLLFVIQILPLLQTSNNKWKSIYFHNIIPNKFYLKLLLSSKFVFVFNCSSWFL